MFLQDIVLTLGCLALFSQVSFLVKRRRRSREGWETLLVRLQRLDSSRYTQDGQGAAPTPDGALIRIVGFKDVWMLQKKIRLLGDLAVLAESWSGEVGTTLAQLIRQDAQSIREAMLTYLIELARMGHERAQARLIDAAVCSYVDARTRILALYELHSDCKFVQLLHAT